MLQHHVTGAVTTTSPSASLRAVLGPCRRRRCQGSWNASTTCFLHKPSTTGAAAAAATVGSACPHGSTAGRRWGACRAGPPHSPPRGAPDAQPGAAGAPPLGGRPQRLLLQRLNPLPLVFGRAWRKAVPLSLLFCGAMGVFSILQSLKDSLVVMHMGVEALPFLSTFGSLPASLAYFGLYRSLLVPSVQPKHLFYATTAPLLLFYAVFALFLNPLAPVLQNPAWLDLPALVPPRFAGPAAALQYWVFSLFHVAADIWGPVVITMAFWTVADEVCSMEEASQLYPQLGLLANLGVVGSAALIKFVMALQLQGPPEAAAVVKVQLLVGALLLVAATMFCCKAFINSHYFPAAAAADAATAAHTVHQQQRQQQQGRQLSMLAGTGAYSSDAWSSQASPAGSRPASPSNHPPPLQLQQEQQQRQRQRWQPPPPPQQQQQEQQEQQQQRQWLQPQTPRQQRQRHRKQGGSGSQASWRAVAALLAASPTTAALTTCVVACGVAGRLLEYALKAELMNAAADSAAFCCCLADMQSAVGVVTICLMLTSKLLFKHLGWSRTALITPTAMLVLGGAFFGACLLQQLAAAAPAHATTLLAAAGTGAGAASTGAPAMCAVVAGSAVPPAAAECFTPAAGLAGWLHQQQCRLAAAVQAGLAAVAAAAGGAASSSGAAAAAPPPSPPLSTSPLVNALTGVGVATGMATSVAVNACRFSLFTPAKEMVYKTLPPAQARDSKAVVDLIGGQVARSGAGWLVQLLVLAFGSITAALPAMAALCMGASLSWMRATLLLSTRMGRYGAHTAAAGPAAEAAHQQQQRQRQREWEAQAQQLRTWQRDWQAQRAQQQQWLQQGAGGAQGQQPWPAHWPPPWPAHWPPPPLPLAVANVEAGAAAAARLAAAAGPDAAAGWDGVQVPSQSSLLSDPEYWSVVFARVRAHPQLLDAVICQVHAEPPLQQGTGAGVPGREGAALAGSPAGRVSAPRRPSSPRLDKEALHTLFE